MSTTSSLPARLTEGACGNAATPATESLRTRAVDRRPGRGNPRRAAAPSLEVVTGFDRFLRLEEEWNDAVERAAVPHPFLTHEWFRTWWECFGGGSRSLHILVVRRGGEVIAIAPLLRERRRVYGVPVRTLDLMHNDQTPRADVIVAGPQAEAYQTLWDALQAQRRDWDVLQFSRVPAESPTHAALGAFAADSHLPAGTWSGDVSPYLPLTGTWDSYLASLSSKFRSNLRNRLTRLTKVGEPRLEVIENAEGFERARADAMRLEASGWKAQAGTSIQSDPAVERFYTRLAERATARGWLRLLFLTAGGRRIATSYGSCYQRRLFLFKTGYDPAFAACAPFKLLTGFAIQAAYAEGLTEVDFLGDAEPWKLEWTKASRPHGWLYVFAPNRRARLLHWLKFDMRDTRNAVVTRWRAAVAAAGPHPGPRSWS